MKSLNDAAAVAVDQNALAGADGMDAYIVHCFNYRLGKLLMHQLLFNLESFAAVMQYM